MNNFYSDNIAFCSRMFAYNLILILLFAEVVQMEKLYASAKSEYETTSDKDVPRVFFSLFFCLAIGLALRSIMNIFNIPLPYRALMLFIGGGIGMLKSVSSFVEEYSSLMILPPSYIIITFLPVLMFKVALRLDVHTFTRSWGQIFFIAVPGVFIHVCFTGMVMMIMLGYRTWSYAMGFLFGTVCSSVYPAEIVRLLKEIGQTKHLNILLEGESLIGDSTVMIMFAIFLGIIDGNMTTWYNILFVFVRFALGGIVIGLIFGKLLVCIMSVMYNDVVNMLILSLVATYLTYYISSEMLSVSGLIAVVVLGIMASAERTSLSPEVESSLLYFWNMLIFITNTMVFLMVGIVIVERVTRDIKVQDYAMVLVTYIVANVGRFLTYILLAPIISRIGYGITFRHTTVAIWAGIRGPLPLCLALKILYHKDLEDLGTQLLIHITGLVMLSLLINATTMPLLLRLLGLSELSMPRKVNMNNCMRHLQNKRDHTIAMLKMDRFLADVNWPLVYSTTVLRHPYKLNLDESDDDEEYYLGYRMTTCPECQKEIPTEPTNKEMAEMTREARMRILKAKKISYSRQYENGLLSKDAMRVLSQAVEVAMDTPEAIIELDGLFRYFRRQGFIHYSRRKLLVIFFKKSETSVKAPRKYWRRICYHIVMHPAFEIIIYCVIILNIIPIALELSLMPKTGTPLNIGIKVANNFFFLIYLVEFLLKIYAYSWIYVCRHGVRTYFKSYWNIFDFIVLCGCLLDVVMDYVDTFSLTFKKSKSHASKVTLSTKLLRVIRLIRLLRLCKAWYPKFLEYCDSKIDSRLAFAYDVGKGYVTGEEEVAGMLNNMIDNKVIRDDCRLRLETDRLAVTKELGMVQKERPWIAITVKTRQAIRATLNSVAEALLELKVSGWVDDVEYEMLKESLEERIKYVRRKIKSVQPSPPKVMFKEIPWLSDDEQLADFLYEHVITRVYDQGDVVCVEGEVADGIYIIVTGLFKLTYIPKKETLNRLAEYGTLPVVDYITSTRFDEKYQDYIVSGNWVGELSVLTGRPYDCTVTADTPSQAYILTKDIIKQAMQRSPDPINGLECKMWKTISVRLVTSILMNTPVYQSFTLDRIHYLVEKAFIPNISNYKVFVVNDMIEDIVLLEGIAFDFNTRDCFTAPCYIPRTVQKLVLPKSSQMNIESPIDTKILIIPAADTDELDIMVKEEEISEMVSTASIKCLQHTVQAKSSKSKKRKKRAFGKAQRRVKYGESKMSSASTVYYSRSRATEASSNETELGNINMIDPTASTMLNSYVLNEKDPYRAYNKDHRSSRFIPILGEKRASSIRHSSIYGRQSIKEHEDDNQTINENTNNEIIKQDIVEVPVENEIPPTEQTVSSKISKFEEKDTLEPNKITSNKQNKSIPEEQNIEETNIKSARQQLQKNDTTSRDISRNESKDIGEEKGQTRSSLKFEQKEKKKSSDRKLTLEDLLYEHLLRKASLSPSVEEEHQMADINFEKDRKSVDADDKEKLPRKHQRSIEKGKPLPDQSDGSIQNYRRSTPRVSLNVNKLLQTDPAQAGSRQKHSVASENIAPGAIQEGESASKRYDKYLDDEGTIERYRSRRQSSIRKSLDQVDTNSAVKRKYPETNESNVRKSSNPEERGSAKGSRRSSEDSESKKSPSDK